MGIASAIGYDVTLKIAGPVHAATIRGVVPCVEDFGDTFDELFAALEAYVAQNGKATGPYIARYLDECDGSNALMSSMTVELAIPFEGIEAPDDDIQVYDIPGAEQMACAVHRGRFEDIGNAYEAVMEWIEQNGYRLAGPMRDIYISCGPGDSPEYVTEVQFPVTR